MFCRRSLRIHCPLPLLDRLDDDKVLVMHTLESPPNLAASLIESRLHRVTGVEELEPSFDKFFERSLSLRIASVATLQSRRSCQKTSMTLEGDNPQYSGGRSGRN